MANPFSGATSATAPFSLGLGDGRAAEEWPFGRQRGRLPASYLVNTRIRRLAARLVCTGFPNAAEDSRSDVRATHDQYLAAGPSRSQAESSSPTTGRRES
jgi:hypothetical protein